jgi:RimJ/RimL family protein N-acetyltransferase
MSEDGTGVQLAVTADGVTPLGEVLLFLREDSAELGYAVGLDHRGARLAARALGLLLDHAREAHGVRRFVLRISPGNVASMRVAEACGFRLTDAPLLQREMKGRPVELGTWEYRV